MRIALFIPSFGNGGVERGFVHTARGLADLGVAVEFVTAHRDRPYMGELPADVEVIELGGDTGDEASHARFQSYLRARAPDVLMSGKDRAHRSALAARAAAGVATKLVMRPGTLVSARHRASRFWRRRRAYREMRATYPQADLLITVSRGVARDTARITGVPCERIRVIPSPHITPELDELAAAPVTHPWLAEGRTPVLVAVGGLRRQKGFDDLLRAFARARRTRALRLIIIGSGRLDAVLRRLARRLKIADDVHFAGFIDNPYPLLAAADLFVLSSRWEGAPTVVSEAVALGCKVVATECGSGPGEILAHNPWSRLVPAGEPRALAAAIAAALDWPAPPINALRASVREYTLDVSAARYRNVFTQIAGTA